MLNSFLRTAFGPWLPTNVVFDCFLHRCSGHQIMGPAPCMSVKCSRCCTCTTTDFQQCARVFRPINKVAEKIPHCLFLCGRFCMLHHKFLHYSSDSLHCLFILLFNSSRVVKQGDHKEKTIFSNSSNCKTPCKLGVILMFCMWPQLYMLCTAGFCFEPGCNSSTGLMV